MDKNEKTFWACGIIKSILFLIIAVLIILLTLSIEKNGLKSYWVLGYSIGLIIISLIYTILETKITFSISSDFYNNINN